MASPTQLPIPVAPVHICERCKLPINGPRYRLRVEATPPEPRGMELSLCADCLASLGRWLDRKVRSADAAGADAPAGGRVGGSLRGRRAGRRPWHADTLDRGVRNMHARLYLTAAAIVVSACGLLGLAVYLLVLR